MAKFTLIPFDTSSSPNINLEAEINQNDESLFISFRINKGVELIDLGSTSPNKKRIQKLWEKTCFEFFIKNQNGEYLEFNFSPSFEWNCFSFKTLRGPLVEWELMQTPATDILLSLDNFFLVTELKKIFFPKGFFEADSQCEISLTSVIKDRQGSISYWALAHKESRPNFHDYKTFVKYN